MRRGEGRAFTRAAELEFLYRSGFEPTTGPILIFLSINNASARGSMGISRGTIVDTARRTPTSFLSADPSATQGATRSKGAAYLLDCRLVL